MRKVRQEEKVHASFFDVMKMIKEITRKNLSELSEIYLHDAELTEVISNYSDHIVEIPVKLYRKGTNGINAVITFKNVVGVDVSFLEPWGEGIYVFGVTAEPVEINSFKTDSLNIMDYFKMSFQPNSGDVINVSASKMVLEEKDN